MLPFAGYNMSEYFQHWLEIGEKLSATGATLPRRRTWWPGCTATSPAPAPA